MDVLDAKRTEVHLCLSLESAPFLSIVDGTLSMPNQILKIFYFENIDSHKKLTDIEGFKVDHSKKYTKFIDNPQNPSNLL